MGGTLHFRSPLINNRILLVLNINISSGVSNYNFTEVTSEIYDLFKHRYPYYFPNFELVMRISSERFAIDEGYLLFTDINFGILLNFHLDIQKISYAYNSKRLGLFVFRRDRKFIHNIRSKIYLNTKIYDDLTSKYGR